MCVCVCMYVYVYLYARLGLTTVLETTYLIPNVAAGLAVGLVSTICSYTIIITWPHGKSHGSPG